jgi:leader peptidase (prepilin peptidase)/N-methyltransferase
MSPVVAVVAGIVVGGVAALLAPWARRLAERDSGWTSRPALTILGGVTGTGAALVADGVVELVTFAAFALGCTLLVALDLACHRLPDIVTVPTAAVLVAGLLVAASWTGSWSDLGRALLSGLVLGAAFLALALISPRSLGLGDVKLAALLGLFLGWFGWPAVAVAVIATFLLGGVTALLLVLSRRATRSTELAFGPWLVLGAAVAAGLTTTT